MRRKTQPTDLAAIEEEIAQVVLQVLDKIDANPEPFQAEADALGATLNQFAAMAAARLIVERLGEEPER